MELADKNDFELNSKLNMALQPPDIQTGDLDKYKAADRAWQGIPGIEIAANGRLWAVWYSGGQTEGNENYVVLATSNDDGKTWSPPKLVIDPVDCIRAFDPVLWHDPEGKLWLFWAQSYGIYDGRIGVWTITCENSGSPNPNWTAPRRICNGIMMNKPTVLSTGDWLLPVAIWNCKEPRWPLLQEERNSSVFRSIDNGKTWIHYGKADIPERGFDEHMIIERQDRSLWMLVRTKYGIGQSFSNNGGVRWTPGEKTGITHIDSRFFIRRLNSGRILLVSHHNFLIDEKGVPKRTHLTAFLSEDDGKTWQGGLLLDERWEVSYPDGVESDNGKIYIIYDYNRFSDKEILMAVIREEDILAGKCVTADARLKQLVNKAGNPGETCNQQTRMKVE